VLPQSVCVAECSNAAFGTDSSTRQDENSSGALDGQRFEVAK
jgi:hypothetical protein